MFIKCEKCGAIFNIDASLIKPEQRLRCSGCSYIFKYEPTTHSLKTKTSQLSAKEKQQTTSELHADEKSTKKNPDKKPIFSVPEEFKPVKNYSKKEPFLWIFLIVIGLIGIGTTLLFFIPKTVKPNISLKQEIPPFNLPIPPLDVIDTSFKIVPDQQNGVRLLVQGALFNPADKTQNTHSFWIELFDANNTLIYTKEIIPVQKKIMGKSTLPFYTEITPVPDTVKRMDIIFK